MLNRLSAPVATHKISLQTLDSVKFLLTELVEVKLKVLIIYFLHRFLQSLLFGDVIRTLTCQYYSINLI